MANDTTAQERAVGDRMAGSDSITRVSLSEQIAERLRDDIIHGHIPPGTHLVQDELCKRFGTSRMPVRDALQQLTHEGVLVLRGDQREVVQLSTEELAEVHALIAVLHGWAAGQVAALASDEEIEELSRLCAEAVAATEPERFGILAWRFHRKINLLARSPRLVKLIVSSQQSVPRTFPMIVPEEMEATKSRYLAIMAAMRDHDAAEAERLVREFSDELTVWLLHALKPE